MSKQKESKPFKTAWRQPAQEFDERFTTSHGRRWHDLEVAQIAAATDGLKRPCSVLEVGCGTGRFTEIMARQGCQACGIDPSVDMLAQAREKTEKLPNVTLVLGEGGNLPFETNRFDFVYSVRVLNHTVSRQYALRTILEMVRVARPGGRILIEFANRLRPRRAATGTVLAIRDVMELASEHQGFRCIWTDGILIFSITALKFVPSFLLPVWFAIDRGLARRLPHLASRCYMLLEKM